MAKIRSVNFLPEIFQTESNKKFLGSTLDQLIQEPQLRIAQGYIGRKSAPGVKPSDGYIDSDDNYQLEPGVVFKDENNNTVDAITYPGIINGLKTAGGNVDNHNRLFESETYSWSPFIDFDKFINYSQYYWLPTGPDSVDVSASSVFLTNDFNFLKAPSGYNVAGSATINPVLTVVRGGSYQFNVLQTGSPFYIQSQPGVDGTLPWASNISSRNILGVENNGEDNGTISFNVPAADAQDFYHDLVDIGDVDIATYERFDTISNRLLSDLPHINNIYNYESKTIIFLTETTGTALEDGWQYEIGNTNPENFLEDRADRYQIFRINIAYDTLGENPYVKLIPIQEVNEFEKMTIQYGEEHSNVTFFKNTEGFFEQVPSSTSTLDQLYYQDATNPNFFGTINVVDPESAATLNINDILGKPQYTSPNGVVFTNGLKVIFRGAVTAPGYTDNTFYVEGVGTAIRLVAESDLVVPERYAKSISAPWDSNGWDTTGMDGTLNAPIQEDYITINRASVDNNAWSRSNRWFHIDVIIKTAEYNNTVAELNNDNRANRPIIEFDADMHLFNYGTAGKKNINIVDFNSVDALSNINGSIGYALDGYQLMSGTRVVFANDADLAVRNKIYEVQMIDINGDGNEIINLVLADDAESNENDVLLVTNGLTQQGTVIRYSNDTWVVSQQKTAVNQPPLFDIIDADGMHLSDQSVYPSTSFNGSKIFSYSVGTGVADPVLGFPLKYLSIDNLGDIVFENNFYLDTFTYVKDNVTNEDTPIKDGFVRKYSSRTEYTNNIGWVTSVAPGYTKQVLEYTYNGQPLELDIIPKSDLLIPSVRVLVNNTFINSSKYTIIDNEIILPADIEIGAIVEIKVISDDISKIGYYEVPTNLSSNIFNENTTILTLGTIRNHYNRLVQNIINIEGVINGSNNSRDLGDISKYGNVIVQQSAPIAPTALFLRNKEYNFFSSVNFASQQYEKFKNQLIEWVTQNDVYGLDTAAILDNALSEINTGKNINSPFHWSDMSPSGPNFTSTTYTISAISTNVFTTLNAYDFEQANTTAILVYHNNLLLTKDAEYSVAKDGPRINILVDLEIDDVVTINEYQTTTGSYIPSTPTKLGLYPKFKPEQYEDNTYTTPANVIRGHDGSVTIAYGDIRDDVLLEFEKRIYNNIKVNANIPSTNADVIPGHFRTTEYSSDEILEIVTPGMLSWLSWNKIDFKNQDYNKLDEKTWNYSSSTSKLGGTSVPGHWRGVYNYFYDTDAPHERPWEMLGLTNQPTWWQDRYGPAPYTSGNLVLWDDLEIGLIKDPNGEYVDERFVRPGLTTILPVDGEGNLLMPIETVVSGYNAFDFKASWKLGDIAPAEAAYRKSSAWPFAMQTLFALTKPARYFALMIDRDRYTFDVELNQYLLDGRHRIDLRTVELAQAGKPKHSYVNWILDYNKHYGYESADKLASLMEHVDVNLCYHMSAFTDKNNLKIFTDKSSPDSTSNSLLLPDESYNLLIHKNQPFDEIIYSSVVVQQLDDGYAVIGNSATDPYFKISVKVPTIGTKTISVGQTAATATTVTIPLEFTDEVEYIPYGYTYKSKQAVVDFLISYGHQQVKQGIILSNTESSQTLNWESMVHEFVNWSSQGWAPSSIINLNPAATQLEFEREYAIVDDLNNLELTERPLNQDRRPLDSSDFVVDRIDNNFKITMLDNNIISYLKFNLTNYEHLLVIDNQSIFNDLIYNPVTGVRQHRVKLSGIISNDWNGTVNAPGYIIGNDNIPEWQPARPYNSGDIVKFKTDYWSAVKPVQPADQFKFSSWIKTDYADIGKDLMPNIATKADQKLHYYDNQTANLESDADLMAFGIIGFRPRDYLKAIDLSDISQVNLYSDLIQSKGTVSSLNLFQNATLDSDLIDYQVFENWAIERAIYGATSSRSYFDLQLDKQYHVSSPSLIEISSANGDSQSDQIVLTHQIYKQSEKNVSPYILPLQTDKNFDTSLPSAGFVSEDDVDLMTFNLAGVTELNPTLVEHGTLIWVAKDNSADWNVYRATAMKTKVIGAFDNVNGTIEIEFNKPHGLIPGNFVIIKYFDAQVDGTYNVNDVTSAYKIIIDGALATNQTQIRFETGTAFKLLSARLDVPSDIADSVHDNILFASDKVWLNNYNDKAAIIEKSAPFVTSISAPNPTEESNTGYGYSVAQGNNNAGMLVGAPGYETTGAVYCFNKLGANDYVLGRILTLADAEQYGASLAMSEHVGVIGAPGSASTPGIAVIIERDKMAGLFNETQILVSPGVEAVTEFGKHVVLSTDENWCYVSDPNANSVHAYQLVEYQEQTAFQVSDGTTQNINLTGKIEIEFEEQIAVAVGGQLLELDKYAFNGTNVILATPPSKGEIITVDRLNSTVIYSDGINASFTIEHLYALNGIESFSVVIDGVIKRPYYDYTFDGVDQITFVNDMATYITSSVGIIISVRLRSYYKYIDTISQGAAGDNFGAWVDVTAESSHVIVSAPNATVSGIVNAGEVHVFERVSERSVVTSNTQTVYNLRRTPTSENLVFHNGKKLVREGYNVLPDYSVDAGAKTITILTDKVKIGDFIDVDINKFEPVQTLTIGNLNKNAKFGNAFSMCRSKCSIYVGAENDSTIKQESGSVTRFVNTSRLTGVITSIVPDLEQDYDPVVTVGDSIRINNTDVMFTGTTVELAVQDIIAMQIPNVTAKVIVTSRVNSLDDTVEHKQLQIELVNKLLQSIANKLDVLPGFGTAFTDLGLVAYIERQVVYGPVPEEYAHFGSAVINDLDTNQLIVSAVNGTALRIINYDDATTTFDGNTTRNIDPALQSGIVYSYDLLQDESAFTEGKLVFGQQIYDTKLAESASFGNAINVSDGLLAVASIDYSTKTLENTGRIVYFDNTAGKSSWTIIKEENDCVDVNLINSVYIYDNTTSKVNQYIDYIDPLNGKILGVARQNIDFISTYDPATYSGQTQPGAAWGSEHAENIWWDISSIRFLNYNQGDPKYVSSTWGKVFPGSEVDMYQWVASDVPPTRYSGTGTVRDVNKFVLRSSIDANNVIRNIYYFWVNKVETIAVNSKKTLSANAIALYIESPMTSGVAYIATIAQNIVGLYNCKDLIVDSKSVLHIEYDKIENDNNIFAEYDLFRENHETDFLSASLYKKLQDSFCGADDLGNVVPDIALPPSDRCGITFRPRKSMFADRFAALSMYLQKVNNILKSYTIAEAKSYPLLDSEEPIPSATSGKWDERVFSVEELAYRDLSVVPVGTTYLTETDSNHGGLWTIYEVIAGKTLRLKQVQSYDTKRFWNKETWYATDFNPLTVPGAVVNSKSDLLVLAHSPGMIVKVIANSNNQWEMFKSVNNEWVRVALEDGTIQFSQTLWDYQLGRYGWDTEVFDAQYNDEEPIAELRNVLRSINEELLIGDLAGERSQTLVSVFNYILAEQPSVNWIYKTSLIDVVHKVRSLSQYAVYQKDNQDYLVKYIEESKPYHTKIKDFLLSYDGLDLAQTSATDFDCPAMYNSAYDKFISPILDDGALLTTDVSNYLATDDIWQTATYKAWFDNYRLTVDSVIITNPGSGYLTAPVIEVAGDCITPAVLTSQISGEGTVIHIDIVNPGYGYLTTPVITFNGGNGSGAKALAVTSNNLVRSFSTTIKYDRYEYKSNIVVWEPETVYPADQLVKVDTTIYKLLTANGIDESPTTFNPALHEVVEIEKLSGVDRTSGFYVADVNSPGLDLSLLINGIAYPGVQVDGVDFDQNTGYAVSNFDVTVFDNFEIGPEGLPTYSETILDAIYESEFQDEYLGTQPADINVDGGQFIDTFHSHAPEELVPGAVFDTLDIKVFSRPGSDYQSDGHAYQSNSKIFTAYSATSTIIDFDGISVFPITFTVVNLTTARTIYEDIDYIVNWPDQTIEVTSNIAVNDLIAVFVYEIGGGNQIHRRLATGIDLIDNSIEVLAGTDEIYKSIIFVNGQETIDYTIEAQDIRSSNIVFTSPIQVNDFISIILFGYEDVSYYETYPVTETFVIGTDTLTMPPLTLDGKNKHVAIVELDGKRLRPPEAARYTGDNLVTEFILPVTGGFSHDLVADNEVAVYLNHELLTFGIDYTLSAAAPAGAAFGSAYFDAATYFIASAALRYVTLNDAPGEGAIIDVYVTTKAEYEFNGYDILLDSPPSAGNVLAVTTFNDTRQLEILTQVFVGPTQIAGEIVELFDNGAFDPLYDEAFDPFSGLPNPLNGLPGSFDLKTGSNAQINVFELAEEILNPDRLWVTVNGSRLVAGSDYIIDSGNLLTLTIPTIAATDVVAVTLVTDSVVIDGANFRLFKDMRDNVAMYRLSSAETYLVADLFDTDDIIYVRDASVLGQPNLAIAKFGILMLNGERITYRERNLVDNTVSGLRRGTAGTAIAGFHEANTKVYDTSAKSIVQWDYDQIWYAPAAGQASNGLSLNNQSTAPALFIKK
jgi:hypothetical protein